MIPFLLLILAHVVGATPTSHLVAKAIYGIDLRTRGSGNLGATNTFRVLGWKAALPVMIVDVFKGWLPAWLFPQIDGSPVWGLAVAYGGAAILGHVYSFWVGFRGGKGIATSGGVYIAVAPLAVLAALLVWGVTVWVTRIVSLGSMLAAVAVSVAVFVVPHEGGAVLQGFTLALTAFVIWAHRSNIRRLLRGEELRFGSGRGESASPPKTGGPGPDRSGTPQGEGSDRP
jgi:glycerol-3-phosphate acyltransferase PlsY